MQTGVVFPQTEATTNQLEIKEYALTAEELGYNHILAYDHILGANACSRPGWSGAYKHTDTFYEPLILFSFLSSITKTIEFASGIIILPQRQTALVAKQAATVDILSNGRLRLGVGTGWNKVEYEALNENFHNRGKRSEEQIELLRLLWSKELVTFKGKYHTITDAGLNPLPKTEKIPVWFGGMVDAVLKRVAKIGEGWFPQGEPDSEFKQQYESLKRYLDLAGRDITEVGIEARISINGLSDKEIIQKYKDWQSVGASHISINTMDGNLDFPKGHIDAISHFKNLINKSL
tara:strand:+ start:464 stop:1336 length:873 start_codon:yes stop_codon:yes gene_type:complete